MKINVGLSIGYSGADHTDELEVDDDATEEEIEQEVQSWANNYIEIWWDKKK